MARQLVFAAYPRISGDEEYGNGLASQLKGIRGYIQGVDGTLPEEYVFNEKHTGTVLERPELTKSVIENS